MKSALEGLRILEYGQDVSAPYCSKLFADLGADVIKIEEPRQGDIARKKGPFPNNIPNIEASGLYLYLNTNKRGVTLDLKKQTGRDIFKMLVKESDVLVEDTKPGTLDSWNIGHKNLRKINPSLIITSITGFGQTGPYREYSSSDLISWHIGGPGYITPLFVGTAAQEPLRAGHMASYVTGISAAVATMCAIRPQMLSGMGQRVDISAFEAMVTLAGVFPMYWPYAKRSATRASHPENYPQGFLRCKDGWISINSWQQWHWERLVEAMENPEWAKEELFKDSTARAQNWESLKQLLEDWTIRYSKTELFEMAKSKRIPLAPVSSIKEIVNNRQLRARDFFKEYNHPVAGKLTYPGPPYRLTETPWAIKRRAPFLGEHNEAIYCGELGFTRSELVKLYEANII